MALPAQPVHAGVTQADVCACRAQTSTLYCDAPRGWLAGALERADTGELQLAIDPLVLALLVAALFPRVNQGDRQIVRYLADARLEACYGLELHVPILLRRAA